MGHLNPVFQTKSLTLCAHVIPAAGKLTLAWFNNRWFTDHYSADQVHVAHAVDSLNHFSYSNIMTIATNHGHSSLTMVIINGKLLLMLQLLFVNHGY